MGITISAKEGTPAKDCTFTVTYNVLKLIEPVAIAQWNEFRKGQIYHLLLLVTLYAAASDCVKQAR